eukprot:4278724-Pleurochrysis_carterae.AAC.1
MIGRGCRKRIERVRIQQSQRKCFARSPQQGRAHSLIAGLALRSCAATPLCCEADQMSRCKRVHRRV